jgi:hypothetical protein
MQDDLLSQITLSPCSGETANILNAILGDDLESDVKIDMIRLATIGGIVFEPQPRALAGRADDTVNEAFPPFLLRDIDELNLGLAPSAKSGAIPRRVHGGKSTPTSLFAFSSPPLLLPTLFKISLIHSLSLFSSAVSK